MSAGMHMIRGTLIALALLPVWTAGADAEPMLSYSHVESGAIEPWLSADADTLHPAIVASRLERGPGLEPTQWHGDFDSESWTVDGNRDQAEAEGSYLSWAFEADVPIDLTALEFGYRRNSFGPQEIQLEVSLDGGATWLVAFDTHLQGANPLTAEVDLAALGLAGATSYQFRLYGWNARRDDGSLSLQNSIVVQGHDGARAVLLRGAAGAMPAALDAMKTVLVHSQDGAACASIPGARPSVPQAAIPGACIEYHITASNTGGSPAEALRIIDDLAPDLIFLDARASGFDTDAPDYAFTTPAPNTDCAVASCEIRMENAILGAGEIGRITIRTLLK